MGGFLLGRWVGGFGGGWRIVGGGTKSDMFFLKVECLEAVNHLQKMKVEAALVVCGSMVSNGFDECGSDDGSEVICNDHGHGQAWQSLLSKHNLQLVAKKLMIALVTKP